MYFNYQKEKKSLRHVFDAEVQRTNEYLEYSLENPLWNFSKQDAQKIILSLIKAEYVKKITVYDSNETIFSDSKEDQLNESELTKPWIQVNEFRVVKNERNIGKIKIWYSSKQYQDTLFVSLKQMLLAQLMTFVFIIVLTFLLLKFSIFNRIVLLNEQFKLLQQNELKVPFVWQKGDEIDLLGQSLEKSRLRILNSIENLENIVADRTAKLSESSKLVSLGEMAGGIAHEINNPLTIISGKSAILMKFVSSLTDVDNKKALYDLDKIIITVERISKIIKGLKTFSRDGSQDAFALVSVTSVVDEALEMCRERFKNHGIALRVNDYDKSLALQCRQVQLGQVLLNLLNNAHDAVFELPDKWIELNIQNTSNEVVITLMDSGSGIPESVQKKMMEPFFTTKPVGKGTGLGLSICLGIIKSHHGTFEYDTSSKNTKFVIKLPVHQNLDTKAA